MPSNPPPTTRGFHPPEALARLSSGRRAERLVHVRKVPARTAEHAPWPEWLAPAVYTAFRASGIDALWSHQKEVADLAHGGTHVVMSTGTASGKSLGYLLPVLTDLVAGAASPSGRGATALYLSPTKALANDQVTRLDALAIPELRVATYDGDTPADERRWIRDHAQYVLTNPDLLHHSLLPGHPHWAPFLRSLRYVVIDECHVYRGVFGSHLAAVLRRLRRVAAHYGAFPTIVLASATVADPAAQASALIGMPVRPVTRDGSPRESMTFGLWEPGLVQRGRGSRGLENGSGPGLENGGRGSPSLDKSGDGGPGRENGGRGSPSLDKSGDGGPGRENGDRGSPSLDKSGDGGPGRENGDRGSPSLDKSGDDGPGRENGDRGSPSLDKSGDDGPGRENGDRGSPSLANGGGPGGDGDGSRTGGGGGAGRREPDLPQRRSAVAETADLLADLVADGVHTVAFGRSRAGVEAVAASAQRSLRELDPVLGTRVAAYRGGYLPEERRDLEGRLRSGALCGLAATNALELGIDVSGLDAVLIAGWPGTRASMWQQAGRAGRNGSPSLAVLIAGDDPLDTYLVHHPEALFDRPVEAAVLDPQNPYVLAPHLAAAAAELPLTEADAQVFGPTMVGLLDVLVARGLLRRRPGGWYWTRQERATDHVSLRGTGETVRIVEGETGRVLGTVDGPAAHSSVHTGAVYVHQGHPFVVSNYDVEDCQAIVVAGDPGWSTRARSVSAFDIGRVELSQAWGSVELCFGSVDVRSRVTSFQRILPGGQVLGEHALDLPERSLSTKAVWWTMTEEMLSEAGVSPGDIPGAAHAAEHAAIAMLPLVATSDRWDIGGVSTALHPDTGAPTILVYDGHPGGAGFAERGFHAAGIWLTATRDAILACECSAGCPSCVQSPKCGNGNEPLDKDGAVNLLTAVLAGSPPVAKRRGVAQPG